MNSKKTTKSTKSTSVSPETITNSAIEPKIDQIRADFPLIAGASTKKADCCLKLDAPQPPENLVYLDNAATLQKSRQVLNAVKAYYETSNANPRRGLYDLSLAATAEVEFARNMVAHFINAESPSEIIFNSGATAGLNTAAMWCAGLASDDEVIISYAEHHSNFLPWVRIVEANSAHLRIVSCHEDGTVKLADFKKALTPNTKVVALNLVGNVFGGQNDIKKLFKLAHQVGAICVLDAAQAVAHQPIDVQALGADIVAFSGHKLGAPMGVGVLYARQALQAVSTPLILGGEMVDRVEVHPEGILTEFAKPPHQFEAGTQNVGGIVGLNAALEYLEELGLENVQKYERELLDYATDQLGPLAEVYGGDNGILAFNLPGIHPHDTAQLLAEKGIAVRAGWHCAQPLLSSHLSTGPVVRASFSFYNTKEEIDQLARALAQIQQQLGGKNV